MLGVLAFKQFLDYWKRIHMRLYNSLVLSLDCHFNLKKNCEPRFFHAILWGFIFYIWFFFCNHRAAGDESNQRILHVLNCRSKLHNNSYTLYIYYSCFFSQSVLRNVLLRRCICSNAGGFLQIPIGETAGSLIFRTMFRK